MKIGFESVTTSLGPGKRYVIWVQGCNKRCTGCINPNGWSTDAGTERSVKELFTSISECKDITGVTISGGEPFLQFEELCQLIKAIRSGTSLDIMIYTGYTVEELRDMYKDAFDELTPLIDILIDGEYHDSENTGSALRGSDNQRIFFFTDKYRGSADAIFGSGKREFSFRINEDGEVYFIGIPPVGFYENFLRKLGGNKHER